MDASEAVMTPVYPIMPGLCRGKLSPPLQRRASMAAKSRYPSALE
jgi:hypothetical protein